MIKDLNEFNSLEDVTADICIIGAGAAGITLALDLMDSKLEVILLESGGMDFEQEAQDLYKGKSIGREYYELDFDRSRQFGGSTSHWGGWCTPLSKIDLETRPWVPHSGWPILWEELEPFYYRANQLCQIGKYNFSAQDWLEPKFPLLKFRESMFSDVLYQYSEPLDFGDAYNNSLDRSDNVNVILHANVIDIRCNEDVSNVSTIEAVSLTGKKLRVKARIFVIACGGIENARILLLARKQNKKGLGNNNDLVGRYFMDHLEGVVAKMIKVGDYSDRWLNSYERRRLDKESVPVMPGKQLSSEFQYKAKVLNASFHFGAVQDQNSGYLSARRMLKGLMGKWREGDIDYFEDAKNVLTDLDEIALWIYHRMNGTNYAYPITPEPAEVRVALEASPNPASRVTLSNDKDKLGLPKVSLDWRVGDFEKVSLRESSKNVAIEIARTTGMRVKLEDWLLMDNDTINLYPGHHHMGTTRMAESSQYGVVDKNCRVFGLNNLYVAGSSIFPTVGHANPTLTIVALASRLSQHLKMEFKT